jgi:hypothetical protein
VVGVLPFIKRKKEGAKLHPSYYKVYPKRKAGQAALKQSSKLKSLSKCKC